MTEISRAAQVANLANEVVSVKDFGAVGDGVTDDTSAIQAALAASKAVRIPAGTYLVSDTLLSTNLNGYSLIGAGYHTTEIKLNANISSLFSFEGTGSGPTYHSNFHSFKGIKFNGTGYTGKIFNLVRSDRNNFEDLRFEHCYQTFYNKEHWDSSFRNIRFEACGDLSASIPAIDLQPFDAASSNTGCNNLVFVDCQFEAQPHIAFRMAQHSRNNRLIGCKFHGALPTPSSSNVVVLIEATYNKFIGCSFTNGQSAFVSCNGADMNTWDGCSFVGTPSNAAIEFYNSDDNCVDSSLFDDNSISIQQTGTSTGNVWGLGNRSKDASKVVGGTLLQLGFGETRLTHDSSDYVAMQYVSAPTTPTNFDSVKHQWFHKNSTGSNTLGSEDKSVIQDITNGSESVDRIFSSAINGSLTEVARLSSGDKTLKVAGSAWDGVHLQLGSYHLWVDALGNLRIKNGTPSSDTDGSGV